MNFFSRVYSLTRQVPAGYVTTYGDIARAMGTKDARRVGQALHANPYPWDEDTQRTDLCTSPVPCHRVVAKDGRLAPHYAFGGSVEQYAKLKSEGITFLDREHVNLAKHRFIFNIRQTD